MTDQDDSTQVTDTQELELELQQMKETAQRAFADLQNYKRRADEERINLVSLGQVNMLTELLPILDNFARAFQHIPEDLNQNEWVNGVIQIEKQLITIIKSIGLEEIPTIGLPANPHLHEVLGQTNGEKDVITQEIEKGYTFKGKLLRASKVMVGKG
jgi:molecular chaperone GrpE